VQVTNVSWQVAVSKLLLLLAVIVAALAAFDVRIGGVEMLAISLALGWAAFLVA